MKGNDVQMATVEVGTGRATCRICGEIIEKGEFTWAIWMANSRKHIHKDHARCLKMRLVNTL